MFFSFSVSMCSLPAELKIFPYQTPFDAGPIVFDETLIGVQDTQIVAKDVRLSTVWEHSLKGDSPIVFFDIFFNHLFVADSNLSVFDARHGFLLWSIDCDIQKMEIAYPFVVVQQKNDMIAVLSFSTGSMIWEKNISEVLNWSVDRGGLQLSLVFNGRKENLSLSTGLPVSSLTHVPLRVFDVSFEPSTNFLEVLSLESTSSVYLPSGNFTYQFHDFGDFGLAYSVDRLVWLHFSFLKPIVFDGVFEGVKIDSLLDAFSVKTHSEPFVVMVGKDELYHLKPKKILPLKKTRSKSHYRHLRREPR